MKRPTFKEMLNLKEYARLNTFYHGNGKWWIRVRSNKTNEEYDFYISGSYFNKISKLYDTKVN